MLNALCTSGAFDPGNVREVPCREHVSNHLESVPGFSARSVRGYIQCINPKDFSFYYKLFGAGDRVQSLENARQNTLISKLHAQPEGLLFLNFEMITLRMVMCGTSFISSVYSYVI